MSEAAGQDPGRRGAIDAARLAALLLVVIGHLLLAVIDRGPDGALRGANLLALEPGVAWLAAAAPMPVFFAAAGWSNARADLHSAARRLRVLVGLGAVVVGAWSAASITELLIRGEGGIVADGARIATQPLWFLAAYVPFTAAGARLARFAARPVVAIGACLTALTAIDLARFVFHAPEIVGWAGFLMAWGVPWLLGGWWRGRWEAGGMQERRAGVALAAASLAAGAVLVQRFGYHPALIDAVKGHRSNTTPPTLFTAVASMAQVGVVMTAAPVLDRVAGRWQRWVRRAGVAAVAVYAWHLTALALCAAALAAGLWAPDRLTTAWWLTRPLWLAVVLGITALLVAVTGRVSERLTGRAVDPGRPPAGSSTVMAGLVLSTCGAAVVGLKGPRTLPAAGAAVIAFAAGWWFLRPRSAGWRWLLHR